MKIKSNDWIFVTGKALSGKTYWIRKHIEKIPVNKLVILDFNGNDYQDFMKKAFIWNVRSGTMDEIETFVKRVYDQGNLYVVLSESDNYLRHDSQVIRALVTTGRNRGIGAIVDGKRPFSVPPNYRGRFNYLVLFKTTLPDDIEYLESWAGTGKGSLEILRTLELGQHIIINLDTQEVSGIQKL